jgi:hypothetical protein
MGSRIVNASEGLYGALVRLYPEHHRREFGQEMQYVFAQKLADTKSEHGLSGVATLWARTIVDTATNLLKEHNDKRNGEVRMKSNQPGKFATSKAFLWLAALTAAILLIPLIGMQFPTGFDWSLSDFVIIGVLIYGIGSLFILGARKIRQPSRRLLFGAACLLLLMYIWAELAVGIFTNWGS